MKTKWPNIFVYRIVLSLFLVSPFLRTQGEAVDFSTPLNLSSNAADSGGPQITVSGRNVYIVWEDLSAGNGDIFLRASEDAGATFGAVKNISHSPKKSSGAQIFNRGDIVYVVWSEGDFRK